jgi:hypothetical protein
MMKNNSVAAKARRAQSCLQRLRERDVPDIIQRPSKSENSADETTGKVYILKEVLSRRIVTVQSLKVKKNVSGVVLLSSFRPLRSKYTA